MKVFNAIHRLLCVWLMVCTLPTIFMEYHGEYHSHAIYSK